jgi:hypothetical protein
LQKVREQLDFSEISISGAGNFDKIRMRSSNREATGEVSGKIIWEDVWEKINGRIPAWSESELE